jgi:hypothetical protein
MSGLSRTPGKRVWDNIPPRVRIPPSPPVTISKINRLLEYKTQTLRKISLEIAAYRSFFAAFCCHAGATIFPASGTASGNQRP